MYSIAGNSISDSNSALHHHHHHYLKAMNHHPSAAAQLLPEEILLYFPLNLVMSPLNSHFFLSPVAAAAAAIQEFYKINPS